MAVTDHGSVARMHRLANHMDRSSQRAWLFKFMGVLFMDILCTNVMLLLAHANTAHAHTCISYR